ncbi:L-threonylcarbamoyladenylate synthase [Candidatus Thioglobus sp.]|nr:L-threonylcarbamoyladenylate synthase [Candidatus Thioglobus sp.]
MALILDIHPKNPQLRLINKVTETIQKGGVIAYPTDSGYALGCELGNKNAMDRILKIRKLKRHHHFTLMLKDLSHVGEYAKLNNSGFRLLKKILPGPYTFILEGTKDIPNRLLNGNRKTIGVRVSSNIIVQEILGDLVDPMMSVSLIMHGYEFYNGNDVRTVLSNSIDLIIDSGHCPPEPTSVIDISENEITILRRGAGSLKSII